MVTTSVFSDRLGRLWNGLIGEWVAETGRRHPEIAWQLAVEELVARVATLRPAMAELSSTCEVLCERLQHGQETLVPILEQIQIIREPIDDALVLALIHQRNALTTRMERLRQIRDTKVLELAAMSDALLQVEKQRLHLLVQGKDIQALLPVTGPMLLQHLQALSVSAELRRLANSRKLSCRPCTFPQGCNDCQAANEPDGTAARRERDALYRPGGWPDSLPA